MARYGDLDKVLELVNEVNEDGNFTSYAHYSYLFDSIDNLPTIEQPERKKGKCVWCDSPFRIEYNWIDRYGNTASFQDEERHIVATGIAKFCPNCGARMDGESDE